MRYKLPVVIIPLKEGGYLARCEEVRATATGDTSEEALKNLHEAIVEMIGEFGEATVFEGLNPQSEVRVIEVAV